MELPDPASVTYTFHEVNPAFTCVENDGNLDAYLPVVTIPDEPYVEFLGVFGRVIYDSAVHYYLYLYVWNGQLFPPHPMDYEPVLVEVHDKANMKAVVYDRLHYSAGRLLAPRGDTISFEAHSGWHSFRPSRLAQHAVKVNALTDSHMNHWWSVPDPRAQLKIREKLRTPFMLNGAQDFTDIRISRRDLALAWIRYPLFAATRRTTDLASCLRHVWSQTVQPARRWLRNPTYKEYGMGYIALVSLLEGYGLISLEPSLRGTLEGIDEPSSQGVDIGLLGEHLNLIDSWALESVKSTEEGDLYFHALAHAARVQFDPRAHAAKWEKRFVERIKRDSSEAGESV